MQRTLLFACAALASLASACGNSTPPQEPPLVADPPPQPAPTEPAPAATPTSSGPSPSGTPEAGAPTIVVGTDPCKADADCVAAQCCHSSACVARSKAPACRDVACTADCRGGTTDCGGGCLCQEGRCAARLMP